MLILNAFFEQKRLYFINKTMQNISLNICNYSYIVQGIQNHNNNNYY